MATLIGGCSEKKDNLSNTPSFNFLVSTANKPRLTKLNELSSVVIQTALTAASETSAKGKNELESFLRFSKGPNKYTTTNLYYVNNELRELLVHRKKKALYVSQRRYFYFELFAIVLCSTEDFVS